MKIPALTFIIICLYPFTMAAQLCQGSLGSAIRQTSFGAGANPGAALPTAATNYSYVSNDCPGDGFYTVRNSTAGCFGSTWHTLSGDRAGNPNGYFMLVNASYTPGDFYVDTVRGLCSGTTFEFAAWVINMLKPGFCTPPILPNLTFKIERTDGTLLQTYSTGDIVSTPSPQWQQIGFFFTTPAGVTDVVLRIANNATGGCGNDLALDDITFRPCGPLINSSITGQPGRAVSFCQGPLRQYVLSCAVSAGFTNPIFQWQQSTNGGTYTDITGANNISITAVFPPGAQPGIYSFRLVAAEAGNMANTSCRIASEPLVVTIDSIPVADAITNSPLCSGETLSLSASGGGLYNWSGPAAFTSSAKDTTLLNVTTAATGRYYVQVTSSAGCTAIDSVDVVVRPSPIATALPESATICEGGSVPLLATGSTNYQWSPAAGLSASTVANPVASPRQTTNYRVIVSDAAGCSDTAYSVITVENTARAHAGADRVTVAGIPVQLSGSATGDNIIYNWWPPVYLDNNTILNPTVSAPAGEYTYGLVVSSACGNAVDSVKVTVYKDLFIPTGFTPNNDGRNDTWLIQGLTAYKDFEVSVYNRAGQLLHSTKTITKGWDGRYSGEMQPTGVYVYIVKTGAGSNERIYKGTVMLVR
jgi:gliding motility-associated-like protein